jgi:hypothetical protein
VAEPIELDAEQAARFVRRGLVLMYVCTAIAAIVLAIDLTIKRAVLEEAGRAQRLLAEAQALAEGAGSGGQQQAGTAGDSSSSSSRGDDAGLSVDDDGPAGAVLDPAAPDGGGAEPGQPDGVAGGTPGHG